MYPFLKTTIRIEDLHSHLKKSGLKNFSDFMEFQGGTRVALQRGRTVTYLQMNGQGFYLKRNYFDKREFLKCLLHLRWPPRNALREWENILAIKNAGINTVNPIAAGESKIFGIEIASFILIEELHGARSVEKVILEELDGNPIDFNYRWKRSVIREIAQIARRMHSNGMCHQDFYLGHIFLDDDDNLYLIDLQRVRHHNRVPRRFVIKDLGQLNYSAEQTEKISKTDRMRFFLYYLGLKSLGPHEKRLARAISTKTARIARHTVKLLERRRRRREIQ